MEEQIGGRLLAFDAVAIRDSIEKRLNAEPIDHPARVFAGRTERGLQACGADFFQQFFCAWQQVARQAFACAGQPAELVSDNGREFTPVWEASLTKFGHLLAEFGIRHLTCAPYYPQGNGKAEAFIKTLNQAVFAGRTFESLAELQVALDRYLTYYSNYRLHSSLGWQAPVTRYAGRYVAMRGLAGILGVEPMAANPRWGVAACDPPTEITPTTALTSRALVPLRGVSICG